MPEQERAQEPEKKVDALRLNTFYMFVIVSVECDRGGWGDEGQGKDPE